MQDAVLKHEFVVCLITLKKILAVTKPVATKLQMVDNDLVACVRDINPIQQPDITMTPRFQVSQF